MARFVIARRDTKSQAQKWPDEAVATVLSSVKSATATRRHSRDEKFTFAQVIEADPAEIAAKRTELPPHLIVEPEMFLWPLTLLPPIDLARSMTNANSLHASLVSAAPALV